MNREVGQVLAGTCHWACVQSDCLEFLRQLPTDSCSLLLGSPPYADARTYSIGFSKTGQAWVDWMVEVYREGLRVANMVAMVVETKTEDYRWGAEPALLMADLHRAGVNLRRPCIFHRVGIPGSGGPDYLRADTEFVIVATRPGRLLWSDPTACGHPPKWAPGGDMSHRLADGARVNQWGHSIRKDGEAGGGDTPIEKGRPAAFRRRPSHKFMSMSSRGKNGERKLAGGRRATSGHKDGDTVNDDGYNPPAIANPGNCITMPYSADELAAPLPEAGDLVHCKVGGGHMGHNLAHQNEAPYPLLLAEFFVRSFAEPDSVVADCFSGSGTTGHACLNWQRRFVGCDVRQSQVDLTRRRLEGVTPGMFA